MRKDAVIINIARGKLINEEALIKYLNHKKIAGAALDVFEQEPLSKNSSLLKMDNVILTPHNASYSPESFKLLKKMAFDEIIRVLLGTPPKCCVY